MEKGIVRLRPRDHFRRFQQIVHVRQALQAIQSSISHLLEDIPAEGCDCEFENNSRRILLSVCDLEKHTEELREALVQAGIRHDK